MHTRRNEETRNEKDEKRGKRPSNRFGVLWEKTATHTHPHKRRRDEEQSPGGSQPITAFGTFTRPHLFHQAPPRLHHVRRLAADEGGDDHVVLDDDEGTENRQQPPRRPAALQCLQRDLPVSLREPGPLGDAHDRGGEEGNDEVEETDAEESGGLQFDLVPPPALVRGDLRLAVAKVLPRLAEVPRRLHVSGQAGRQAGRHVHQGGW